MKFKKYLITEKTFSISRDVKYIYDECFDPLIRDIWLHAGSGKFLDFNPLAVARIRNGKFKKFWSQVFTGSRLSADGAVFKQISSRDLPSKDAQNASKFNEATIFCGVLTGGNFYRPYETVRAMSPHKNAPSVISLSINHMAVNVALAGGSFGQKDLPTAHLRDFSNEFNPARIKSTIAHEISHWMNDTFHNFHITKTLKTVRELSDPEILKLHKKDVNMTHFEIDAQVHGIKQLKMKYKKTWDTLTLPEIFAEYNSLKFMGGSIYKNYGKEVGDIWQKALVKRLARENLLGKKMNKFAKYPIDF